MSLKKETVIAAVVFFGAGFLAGYVYDAQRNAGAISAETASSVQSSPSRTENGENSTTNADRASVASSASDAATAAGMPASSGLPQGHPPIDSGSTIKLLEDRAAKDSGDPKPRLELANFLYDQKQFKQAITWYQNTLDLDPKNISARTDMATCYFNLGRPEEAIREYRKSLQLDPNHQPTLFNLIVANLHGTHNLPAAQSAWDELHRLNPDYPGLDSLKQGLANARN